MKIGFISFHSFSNPGGVKSHILGLAREFNKMGVETKIIVPRRHVFENYGKDVILLGTSIPINIAGTQGDLCFNLNPFAINKILRKEKFDVLHFHNFVVPSGWQILDRSKCTNVLTFHANLDAIGSLMKSFYFTGRFFKELGEKMDGVIGVAKLNLESFEDLEKPKAVIPNGIDLTDFHPGYPKIKRFSDNKINLLFVGRIEERKGLIYLLEAYNLLKPIYDNIRLIIVGDGHLRQSCLNYARQNHLKDVHFEGAKNNNELKRYFSTCDIYCSPAIFGESFGIVLLEGMAMGKPICGFANSGYKELLSNTFGEQFLAEPKNSVELAEKLEILIKDKEMRQKMSEWGLEHVKQYSWKNIAQQVLDFYELCRKTKNQNSCEK
jgi:phosphatidylinositol alpha-mannosyltransferase